MYTRKNQKLVQSLKLATVPSLLAAVLTPSLGTAAIPAFFDTYSSTVTPTVTNKFNVNLNVSPTDTTYLRFNTQNFLPAGVIGANVGKATLKVFVSSVTAPGSLQVFQVTGNWSEGTLTENTKPTLGGALAPTIPVTALFHQLRWIEIDITPIVKNWLNGQPNFGIALKSTLGLNIVLNSKENVVGSHEPNLDIVLQNFGPAGATGATGAIGPKGATGAIGPKGATGATGPQGIAGPTGATGPQGDPGIPGTPGPQGDTGFPGLPGINGVSGYEIVQQNTTVGGLTSSVVDVLCPGGKVALAGDFKRLSPPGLGQNITDYPTGAPIALGWQFAISNGDPFAKNFTLFVTCIISNDN